MTRRVGLALAACLVVLVAAAVVHAARPARMPPPTSPTRAPVVWHEVAGVRVPFSPVDGPLHVDGALASHYLNTPDGAAVAAVQLLVRTSPTAGPDLFEPTLTTQVVREDASGFGDALRRQYDEQRRRLTVPLRFGDPLPGNDATVLGFIVTQAVSDRASVDVLLTAPQFPDAQVLAVTVSLRWLDGDWRLVPPPDGDWATVSRLLAHAPSTARSYDEVR